jgi:sigma-54 specific flagellar transcriptional regulator A
VATPSATDATAGLPALAADTTAECAALSDSSVLRVLEQAKLDTTAATLGEAAQTLAQLPPDGLDLRVHLAAIERRLIEQALQRANGTVAHAARLLNLRRTTLVEKLKKLDIATAESLTED